MSDAAQKNARILRELNRTFYAREGERFAQKRSVPWPGFLRVADLLEARCSHKPPRVWDAGCGPGRFAEVLAERGPATYLGTDASRELLAVARSRLAHIPGVTLLPADLLEGPLPTGPFDLVLCAAVLHHIPSREARTRLVRAFLQASVGLVALTYWQLDSPALQRRVVSWDRLPEIDTTALEPGDRLLTFEGSLRFVHGISSEEEHTWSSDLVEAFDSDGPDGRSNRYVILEKRA